jgi:IclR family acetate operon transcriptional repressor
VQSQTRTRVRADPGWHTSVSIDAKASRKPVPNDVIHSAARALEIVDCLAANADAVTARQLSVKLGIGLPTVYHLLNTLTYAGYAEKINTGYILSGDKISNLYASFMRSLRAEPVVVSAIHRLAIITRETVYAARLVGESAVIVSVAEGSQAVRVGNLYPGLRGNEYARAAGKILLAFLPEEHLETYIRHTSMTMLTPHTIIDPAELRSELQKVRENGYAIDREGFAEGVCCLSVPIMRSGATAPSIAISVTIPSHRFDAAWRAHLHSLQEMRRELESAAGC